MVFTAIRSIDFCPFTTLLVFIHLALTGLRYTHQQRKIYQNRQPTDAPKKPGSLFSLLKKGE